MGGRRWEVGGGCWVVGGGWWVVGGRGERDRVIYTETTQQLSCCRKYQTLNYAFCSWCGYYERLILQTSCLAPQPSKTVLFFGISPFVLELGSELCSPEKPA